MAESFRNVREDSNSSRASPEPNRGHEPQGPWQSFHESLCTAAVAGQAVPKPLLKGHPALMMQPAAAVTWEQRGSGKSNVCSSRCHFLERGQSGPKPRPNLQKAGLQPFWSQVLARILLGSLQSGSASHSGPRVTHTSP